MDAKERWQALQAHLTTARALFQSGDRPRALAEIDAALIIDPQFLAAHTLRHQIMSAPAPATIVAGPIMPPRDGYRRFEERARRRRADRRVEAARSAIARNKLKEAAAAIDELRELDPNLPEVADLVAALAAARRPAVRPHRGRWAIAGIAFASMVLAATWINEPQWLPSRSTATAAPIASAAEPAPIEGLIDDSVAAPVATSGPAEFDDRPQTVGVRDAPLRPERAEVAAPPVEPARTAAGRPASPVTRAPESRVADVRPVDSRPAETRLPEPRVAESRSGDPRIQESASKAFTATPPSLPPAPPVNVARAPSVVGAAAAAAPVSSPDAAPTSRSIPSTAAEEVLVNEALQRYRHAYEGLDAQSAHAVWPAVNTAALARAFDGLASQQLTFDVCNVELRGESATATCHGSAQYVPKVGSRDPRVEPRIWNFTLRKLGPDWKIQTARAER